MSERELVLPGLKNTRAHSSGVARVGEPWSGNGSRPPPPQTSNITLYSISRSHEMSVQALWVMGDSRASSVAEDIVFGVMRVASTTVLTIRVKARR